MAVDPIDAVRSLVEVLDNLNVPYAISGSFASSMYGAYRMSADCDLVAHLRAQDVEPLLAALGDEFYADSEMIHDAILRRRSFNLIHLDAVFKIDVFIPLDRPYDRAQIDRRVKVDLSANSDWFAWFVSPEDCILSKLEWYRLGNELSDRQWSDILGVVKVQSDRLDLPYLYRWAADLRVNDLLTKALCEGGVT